MNKWEEFDYIKTPEDWKNISFEKNRKPRFHLSFIVIAIVLCISLTTVAAYHNELERWIYSYFHSENVHKVNNIYKINRNNMQLISNKEGVIAYEYEENEDGEEIVKQAYVVKNHKLQKLDSTKIKGRYKDKAYSFEYIIFNHFIYTYNHSGAIEYTLPYIKNNMMYVITKDKNMASFHLKTREIKQITDDNKSVNPIMSPNGKNILINKSDEYWTVYNTETQIEKRVDDIDGYSLDNEVRFIDDDHVLTYHITYNENSESTMMYYIDLNTLEKKTYDAITDFASPIVIEKENQCIKIKNILTNQKYTLENIDEDTSYYLTRNYILFFNYIQEDAGYLYSIEENKIFEIKMPKDVGDIDEINILDETKELLIVDDKNFYFIDISHIF